MQNGMCMTDWKEPVSVSVPVDLLSQSLASFESRPGSLPSSLLPLGQGKVFGHVGSGQLNALAADLFRS